MYTSLVSLLSNFPRRLCLVDKSQQRCNALRIRQICLKLSLLQYLKKEKRKQRQNASLKKTILVTHCAFVVAFRRVLVILNKHLKLKYDPFSERYTKEIKNVFLKVSPCCVLFENVIFTFVSVHLNPQKLQNVLLHCTFVFTRNLQFVSFLFTIVGINVQQRMIPTHFIVSSHNIPDIDQENLYFDFKCLTICF